MHNICIRTGIRGALSLWFAFPRSGQPRTAPEISSNQLTRFAKRQRLLQAFSALVAALVCVDVVAQYDYASGDEDPLDGQMERFDTLYGARSFELGPSGIYGPFVRGNLESVGVLGIFRLAPRWTLMATLRGFWLASKTDEWIAAELRDEAGASGDYIGRQLESWLVWDALPERLTLQLGLAHLRYGRFALTVPGATGRTHTTYLYGQVTYRVGSKQ